MPDKINYYDTSKVETVGMGQAVDDMMQSAKNGRFVFERHWYDNNWFYDGYHFRFLSRQQNKIIDLTERANMYAPIRSIPKASKQVDSIANVLTSPEYVPVVYPERIEKSNYQSEQEYMQAKEIAKTTAKQQGHWITEEYKEQDILNKYAHAIILALKHNVAYLHVTPDAVREKIRTVVRDAFDVYLVGENNEVEESPFVIVGYPKVVSEIKANEDFDEEQRMSINPDNKLASSEIKEAYMKARYGRQFHSDSSATITLKEAYIREYLCKENIERINKQENGGEILKDKKHGDIVIRQVFVAGNIWLKDEYLELSRYPIVDVRLKPGPIYQVPWMERFMAANKSLDQVVSRLERFTNTMGVGVWMKKAGEQFNITNQAGGQIVEYKSVPPRQGELAPVPAYVFNMIELLTSYINEQGLSIFSKLPTGVTAYKAIEALKQAEFSDMQMPSRMIKKSLKNITELLLEYADKYFITPKEISFLEKGEPQYFDIVGKTAMDKRNELGVPVEGNVVPISKDCTVEIDIQNGMAYTPEGRKASAKELGDYMVQLTELGVLPPEVINKFLEVMLEQYQFGPTSEVMQILDKSGPSGNLTDQQIQAIKIAVMEVFKDLKGSGVLPDTEQRIEETKVGVAEALMDTGVTEKAKPAQEAKPPSVSIGFKDLPPSGKMQAAAGAGIALDPSEVQLQEAMNISKTITSDKGQQTKGKNG